MQATLHHTRANSGLSRYSAGLTVVAVKIGAVPFDKLLMILLGAPPVGYGQKPSSVAPVPRFVPKGITILFPCIHDAPTARVIPENRIVWAILPVEPVISIR